MTGLDKITSQIQEEAEASAKERLDAANKEAEQILADAQAACKVMEQEALEKAAAEKIIKIELSDREKAIIATLE